MDSLNETLSLEQFMAGCEGVGTHHGLGGIGVGVGSATHLGMSVPIRTLEITPVKDAPPPSSVPNSNTTMSVLTPVKAERLQQGTVTSQEHHHQHHQNSSHSQASHHASHHGSTNQSGHNTAEHTRINTDTKSIKSEGILQYLNVCLILLMNASIIFLCAF